MHSVLFLLTLVLKSAVLWFLWQEYHWPYGTRAWRQGWAVLGVSVLYLGVRYILIMWRPEWIDLWPLSVEMWMPIHAGLLLVGLSRLSSVFHQELPVVESPRAMIIADASSTILDWGPYAETLFGWTKAEVLGQTLMQTIIQPHDHAAHLAGIAQFLASGANPQQLARTFTVNARGKDGRIFPVEMTISAYLVDGKWQFHGVARRLVAL